VLPFLPVACCLSCLMPFLPAVCCLSCLLLAAFHACCLLPFLPVAFCLSCLLLAAFSACCLLPFLLAAFPACCWLPFVPVACCLSCLFCCPSSPCTCSTCAPHYLMSCCPLLPASSLLCAAFMPTVCCLSNTACLQLWILSSVSVLLILAGGCKAEEHTPQSVIDLPVAMLCACWRDLNAAMLTLALVVGHRWVKNMNQGTEGSEVDDLLQLSYLQRLARQKVAEMEVTLFHLPSLHVLFIEGNLSSSPIAQCFGVFQMNCLVEKA